MAFNMVKKYQIFISSTYEDLKEERRAVWKEVLSMNHFPVGMETFGAASVTPWDIIKGTIDQSDYYVLIVGGKYGSTISDGEDQGMSYTEKEYWYAKEHNIPIIAFIASDDANLSIDEDYDKREALLKFKKEIKSNLQVESWMGSEDLSSKVSASLYNEFSRNPRNGWIRGGSGLSEGSLDSKEQGECGNSNQVGKRDDMLLKYDDLVNELKLTPAGMILSDLAVSLGINENSLIDMLEKLIENGVVEKVGTGENTIYRYYDEMHPWEGKHTVYSDDGIILSEGIWENGKLIKGIEYDWIIKDENDSFKYNPLTDDYDGEVDTEILEYYQYYEDRNLFYYLQSELEYEGLDKYYICDIRIDEDHSKYEYFNIRKLSDWLRQVDPDELKNLEGTHENSTNEKQ